MKRIYSLLIYIVFINTFPALATTYTWTGNTSTAWNTTSNWSPSGTPTTGDFVHIYSATYHPVLPGKKTLSGMTMHSGTLNCNGDTLVLNSGASVFSGGTISNGRLELTGTQMTFGSTTFNVVINAVVSRIDLNAATFNNYCYFETTTTVPGTGNGGATFNDSVYFYHNNTGAGVWSLNTVTDNRFYSCKAGITVYNSGAMGGSIESNGNGTGNDFSGCWRGIQTFQDNRNLYIRCNRFFNHQALGQYSAAWAIFGSLADQGHNSFSDPYAPVSNQFDKAPLTRVDVYSVANPNGGFNFGYYHYSISSDPLGRPLASTNTVNVLNTSHTRPVDACDGTHLEPTGPYDPQAAIVQIDNEANEAIREMMISRLITWYLDNNQMETAITYLEERGDHAARERLLAIYMDNGSLTEAQALIDEMQGCTDAECLDFIYLNTLLIDWQINNTSPFDMDNQTHDNIQEIAERQNRVSVQAQALLALVYGSEFLPEIIDTAVARMANTNEWVDRDAFIQTLQPNPAKDDLTISFGQAIPMGAELMLTDYTGRLVKQLNIPENSEQATIDVATLSKGIYTVQLMVNKVTHSIKRFSKL